MQGEAQSGEGSSRCKSPGKRCACAQNWCKVRRESGEFDLAQMVPSSVGCGKEFASNLSASRNLLHCVQMCKENAVSIFSRGSNLKIFLTPAGTWLFSIHRILVSENARRTWPFFFSRWPLGYGSLHTNPCVGGGRVLDLMRVLVRVSESF